MTTLYTNTTDKKIFNEDHVIISDLDLNDLQQNREIAVELVLKNMTIIFIIIHMSYMCS